MNTKDVVLRKEGDGKLQYQKCSAEAGIAGVSRIFDMLCDDEMRHADALRCLQNGVRVELEQSPTLEGARRILRTLSMRDRASTSFHGDLSRYLSAMDFESTSADLCCQLARQADSGWQKELCLKIAAEDEVHFTLIEQIRELLADEAGDGVLDAN